MTEREQLIQEIEQAPEELVQALFLYLQRVKAAKKEHPLARFVGILSDEEAEEIRKAVFTSCRQVEKNEW